RRHRRPAGNPGCDPAPRPGGRDRHRCVARRPGPPGPRRGRGTPSMTPSNNNNNAIDPIRLAVPSKGHLYEGVVEILKTAGYKVRRASDRQYEATIAGQPRFHVVFMRPTDIVTQVEEGRCHLGVTGMDLYAERAVEAEQAAVVIPDLGYGGCRLV